MWFSISLGFVALVSVAAVGYLWRRNRQMRAEARQWAALAELGEETNYLLACQLFSKSAIDRAIRQARDKGAN